MQHRRPIRARGAEPAPGDLRVAPHGVDAIAAQECPEVRDGALDGVAVGEQSAGRRALGGRSPPLGVRRPAHQRRHQGAVDGDPRVALDQALGLEPLHPAHDGVGPPTRPRRVRQLQDQATHAVGVSAGLRVLDGDLRPAVGLVPRCGPEVQLGDELGLAPPELRRQQLAEETVVAVPVPVPVERDHQQVPAFQLVPATALDRVRPSVASHSGPHIRSRIEVRVRNDTSVGESRSRNSERR